MTHRLFRIFVIPLLIPCPGVLLWYLFSKFVLKLNLPLEAYSAGLVALIYIPLVVISWRSEGVGAEGRERAVAKYMTLYGKAIALWVSIQFLIVAIAILAISFFYVLR